MPLVPPKHTPCPIPADFDQESYHRLGAAVAAFHDRTPWRSFASGFNAVAFRFAAADESHDRFVAAITASDAFSPSGPRYAQEVSLFSFFVNALSTLECLCFALYNLGACIKPGAFPAQTSDDLRKVDIKQTARRFKQDFHGEPLSRRLVDLRDSKELKALRTHRDSLAHRGAPPRRHLIEKVEGGIVQMQSAKSAIVASNPKDVPANWTMDLEVGTNITAEPRAWLATTTNRLLLEAAAFVESGAPRGPGSP